MVWPIMGIGAEVRRALSAADWVACSTWRRVGHLRRDGAAAFCPAVA